MASSAGKNVLGGVRVLTMDVTGALVRHRQPIATAYAKAAKWSRLPNPPTQEELAPAFKNAYRELTEERPCFGAAQGDSSKVWWSRCVERCLKHTGREMGRDYSEVQFRR